jgi:hypothetical protein
MHRYCAVDRPARLGLVCLGSSGEIPIGGSALMDCGVGRPNCWENWDKWMLWLLTPSLIVQNVLHFL